MKSAAVQRKNFKIAKNLLSVIAKQIRGQAQLDTMLMRYEERKRKVIFRHMRPFLQFDAIMPTEENTAVVTPESFAKLREKYGEADNSEKRSAMPQSEFALPGGRYPVNDRSHAANAKARATQQLKKGNLTIAEAQRIRAKANRKLGE